MWISNCVGAGAPNPCIVQGSTGKLVIRCYRGLGEQVVVDELQSR